MPAGLSHDYYKTSKRFQAFGLLVELFLNYQQHFLLETVCRQVHIVIKTGSLQFPNRLNIMGNKKGKPNMRSNFPQKIYFFVGFILCTELKASLFLKKWIIEMSYWFELII
jgi:hypothetical protein